MSHPSPSNEFRQRKVPEREAEAPEVEEDAEDALRTLFLDSDDAGDLISSLSSDTARSILVQLHDDPSTASELADHVGTSVQNVRHHLDNLKDSGLVQVSDTKYSSKGREMDVYAPSEEPLVVFVGSQDGSSNGFVDSLKRFVGAIGLLGIASALLQWFVWTHATGGTTGEIIRAPQSLGGGGVSPLGIPAGALFFAGGALMLAVASSWRYWQRRSETPS